MNPDLRVIRFLAAHRDVVLTWLARLAMAAGTNRVVLVAVAIVAAGVVAARHWWRPGLTAAAAYAVAEVAAKLLKLLIARPRPPFSLALARVGGWAMPSTEAAVTSALAVAIFLAFDWASPALRRAAGWVLAVGVAAVGCALVYLGVHWPTDVLVGWVLGAFLGAVAVRVARALL